MGKKLALNLELLSAELLSEGNAEKIWVIQFKCEGRFFNPIADEYGKWENLIAQVTIDAHTGDPVATTFSR